jgi:hypothetical protein
MRRVWNRLSRWKATSITLHVNVKDNNQIIRKQEAEIPVKMGNFKHTREHPQSDVDVMAFDVTGLLVQHPQIQNQVVTYDMFVWEPKSIVSLALFSLLVTMDSFTIQAFVTAKRQLFHDSVTAISIRVIVPRDVQAAPADSLPLERVSDLFLSLLAVHKEMGTKNSLAP